MGNIIEIFKDKEFDDEALDYLENAINEFDEIFGKYVSREELINRINENLDLIEFVDEISSDSGCILGTYNVVQKKIRVLNNLKDDEKKSVFFHELLHAEAADRNNTGFYRIYDSNIYDEDKSYIGQGWNEGFVQMMTVERDRKITGKVIVNSYPILTESVEFFSNLFGKEKLIDLYHNSPNEFIEIFNNFMKKNTSNEYYELFAESGKDFLKEFDIIQKYEKDIYNKKNPSSAARLIRAIFEFDKTDQDFYSKRLLKAQENIIEVYTDILINKDTKDLDGIMNNIKDLYYIFSKDISINNISRIIDNVPPQLLENLNELSEDNKLLIETYYKYIEFDEANTGKKITMISDGLLDLVDTNIGVKHNSLVNEIYYYMANSLYNKSKEDFQEDCGDILYMIEGISKYILENNLPIDNIEIVCKQYDNIDIYELYNYQEDGTYQIIETLVKDFKKSKEGENDIISFKDIDEASKQYSEIATEEPYKEISIDSINEVRINHLNKSIQKRADKLKYFKENYAPANIIQNALSLLDNVTKERNDIINSIRNANNRFQIQEDEENDGGWDR